MSSLFPYFGTKEDTVCQHKNSPCCQKRSKTNAYAPIISFFAGVIFTALVWASLEVLNK